MAAGSGVNAQAEVAMPIWNVRQYGAVGDGLALDSQAIQKAIDSCAEAGGGTVYFPVGTFRAGTIILRSNITLHLEAGATLQQSKQMEDYTKSTEGCYVRKTGSDYVFLHGSRVNHVTIAGGGTIDGNLALDNDSRGPLSILFENSTDILLKDVTVTRSPGWSITFFGCRTVDIIRVKCISSFADGINPVCCQDVSYDGVLIESSGDDAITIKNESIEGYPPDCGFLSENIIITNTIVRNTTHPAFKIGTGTAGVFRNIAVNNCIFENNNSMFTIQLMRPDRKEVPERVIKNISFSDIILRNTKRMFDITSMDVTHPIIRQLSINNIIAEGLCNPSLIHGLAGAAIEDVTISNVKLTHSGGVADCWLDARYVNGLRMSNIQLDLCGAVDSILIYTNSNSLELDRVIAKGLTDKAPAIQLNQVQGASIYNSAAPAAATYVHAKGPETDRIAFVGADMRKSKVPFAASEEVGRDVVYPIANKVKFSDLSLNTEIASNERFQGHVTVTNEGEMGFVLAEVCVDGLADSREWLWLEQNESRQITLASSRYFKPRTYQISIGPLTQTATVKPTPAMFEYGREMQVVSPAAAGELTTVTVTLKNVGGEKGTEQVTLFANGKAAASVPVTLESGQQTSVTIEHRFTEEAPRVLKVGDLPDWPFATFTNTQARFYQVDGKIIMDAGGGISQQDCSGDHSAMYLQQVEGDFVATVRLLSHGKTSPHAAVGLLARNRIAGTAQGDSAGLAIMFVIPIYGGYAHWSTDCDGDGRRDVQFPSSCSGYPLWFMMEKRGEMFTGYSSHDGNLWHIALNGKSNTARAKEGLCRISSAKAVQDVGIYAYAYSAKGELSHVELCDFGMEKPIAPESLQFSNLTVLPERIGQYDKLTAGATVTSTASAAGFAKIALYVDKHEPFTKWLKLNPGESQAVEFCVSPMDIKEALWTIETDPDYPIGSHQISIGTTTAATITVIGQ